MFMAQTGPFSVPLKCTAKRCLVSDFVHSVQQQSQKMELV